MSSSKHSRGWSLPHPQAIELERCRRDPARLLTEHGQVYDATSGNWLPFKLWPAQLATLRVIDAEHRVCILKARQLGFSWLVLGYALWSMIYRPAATVLIFSKRDDEAVELLDQRLQGMFHRLPAWMKPKEKSPGKHQWQLANGSRAMAFPTTGGRSYTASLVIVDEADFVPDLRSLLNAVKPTVDAGGRLILLSTADKSKPQSAFKEIYRKAKAQENSYRPVFFDWSARPDRTDKWYEEQRRDMLSDDLHQEYPATDVQALAPRSLDKRIAPAWIEQCYQPQEPLSRLPTDAPAIPGLTVYALPVPGRRYAVGADPAEGNPTSDDSAATIVDALLGEEVANLVGKLQPSTFGAHLDQLAAWYNDAGVLVERNNHGHAVLLWLQTQGSCQILLGADGKVGWLSSAKGKVLLYNACADAFRNRETILHDFTTQTQLSLIEGSTLRAPEGEHDDRADSYALALVAAPIVLTLGD